MLNIIEQKDIIDTIVSSIAKISIKDFDIAVLGVKKISSSHIYSFGVGP